MKLDIYDLRLGKYKDPNAPIDTGNGNDFYLYRYADILLIFAEAENKAEWTYSSRLRSDQQGDEEGPMA